MISLRSPRLEGRKEMKSRGSVTDSLQDDIARGWREREKSDGEVFGR